MFCRYDHLKDLLNKILSERPENAIDYFEEFSRRIKEERFRPLTDHLRDIYVLPGRLDVATEMMPKLKVSYSDPCQNFFLYFSFIINTDLWLESKAVANCQF